MRLLDLALACLAQAPPDDLPRAAPGWSVELVARAPDIRFPSAVCAAPDGRIFVAEDVPDQSGPVDQPIGRVVCVHPGGRISVFADRLHATFGLAYLDGHLFVQNAPRLTVFADGGEAGLDRREIFESTLPRPWEPGGVNDHVPANFRLGMDGRFYATCGSKGLYGLVGRDGRAFEMRMGGAWTFRPDGSEPEILAQGTRNTLDVALLDEDEAFLLDNNCHMAVWPSGLFHARDGAYFGYPYHYKPRRTPAEAPIADLGFGASAGAVAYTEGVLPEEFDNNIFMADWGRGQIDRLRLARQGASWTLQSREPILTRGGEFRPIALDVASDGLGLLVADWNYPGSRSKKPAGRLFRLRWTGPSRPSSPPSWYVEAATGRRPSAGVDALLQALSHRSRRVRLVAQRELVFRGPDVAPPAESVLLDGSAAAVSRWHALWTLDGLGRGREATLKAVEDADASVRAQAVRQLGLRRVREAASLLRGRLVDPDARVRLQAVVALGRLADPGAVASLTSNLADPDSAIRSASAVSLARIGRGRPEVWVELARSLGDPRADVREAVSALLEGVHAEEIVRALADPKLPSPARPSALRILARLYRRPPPWDGTWWRRGPYGWTEDDRSAEARIDRTELWEGSSLVQAGLHDGLRAEDPGVRHAAVLGLGDIHAKGAAPMLRELLAQDEHPRVRAAALRALSQLKEVDAVREALKTPQRWKGALSDVADAVLLLDNEEASRALLPFLSGDLTPIEREAVLEALGALTVREAVPVIQSWAAQGDLRVSLAAVRALGRLGEEEALIRSLSEDRTELRRAAATALAPLRSRKAVPALVQAWRDPQTRLEALEALVLVPDPRAREAYLDGLASRSTNLRSRCRDALKSLGLEPPASPAPPAREQFARFALSNQGDPVRGRGIFHDPGGPGCIKCHRAGGSDGGDLGPDLSSVGAKYDRTQIVESILFPSRQISEGFRQTVLRIRSGDVVAGVLRGEDPRTLILFDRDARRFQVRKEDVLDRKESDLSLMPDGLEAALSLQDFSDLCAYLRSLTGADRR